MSYFRIMPFRWCPFCSWCPFFGAPLDGAPLAVPLWQCPFDGAPLDGAPLTSVLKYQKNKGIYWPHIFWIRHPTTYLSSWVPYPKEISVVWCITNLLMMLWAPRKINWSSCCYLLYVWPCKKSFFQFQRSNSYFGQGILIFQMTVNVQKNSFILEN